MYRVPALYTYYNACSPYIYSVRELQDYTQTYLNCPVTVPFFGLHGIAMNFCTWTGTNNTASYIVTVATEFTQLINCMQPLNYRQKILYRVENNKIVSHKMVYYCLLSCVVMVCVCMCSERPGLYEWTMLTLRFEMEAFQTQIRPLITCSASTADLALEST